MFTAAFNFFIFLEMEQMSSNYSLHVGCNVLLPAKMVKKKCQKQFLVTLRALEVGQVNLPVILYTLGR